MKKHLFLISFEFLPFANGGLARHATEMIPRIIRQLKKNGATGIVAMPRRAKLKLPPGIIGIPCIFYSNKYLCYPEFTLRVFSLLRRYFHQDIFIFFSSFSFFFFPVLPNNTYLFVTNTTKRVFLTDYPEESRVDRMVRRFIYYFLAKWENYLCSKSRRVFVISQSTKEDVRQQYETGGEKITIIDCAIDKRVFKPVRPKTVFTKHLLFMGRLVPRKNIFDLLKIMELIIRADPEFKLHVVGKGDPSYQLRLKIWVRQRRLSKNIYFHGFVPDSKLGILYKECGIFVFTSLVEGFSLVALEAMAKGLPVVAYKIVGIRDVVLDKTTGYLVEPFDYKQFAEKIFYLRDHREVYRKMSLSATERAFDFNWNQAARRTITELE